MIHDRSASSRRFSDPVLFRVILFGRVWNFLQHVVVQPLGVLEQPSEGSGPTILGEPHSTAAALAVIRGNPSPVLIFVRPCRPQPAPQTALVAGRQSSRPPHVDYTWCGGRPAYLCRVTRSAQQQHRTSSKIRNHSILTVSLILLCIP